MEQRAFNRVEQRSHVYLAYEVTKAEAEELVEINRQIEKASERLVEIRLKKEKELLRGAKNDGQVTPLEVRGKAEGEPDAELRRFLDDRLNSLYSSYNRILGIGDARRPALYATTHVNYPMGSFIEKEKAVKIEKRKEKIRV